MNRNTLTGALALAAIGLSACGGHEEHMVNSKICTDFKTTTGGAQAATPSLALNDAAAPVDDCLRRWAYSVAGARDSADVVAYAVVAACGAPLSRWNQGALAQPGSDQAVSITTGQPTNALAEHAAFAHGRALLYVVQARAGRCSPPPAANAVPTLANGTPAGA